MADLYVDVDALSELSRQLDQIKAALQDVNDDLNVGDASLGSGKIASALDDFVEGWKDGREKIIAGIDGLLGRISGAIETYETQERELSRAAGGETARPQGGAVP